MKGSAHIPIESGIRIPGSDPDPDGALDLDPRLQLDVGSGYLSYSLAIGVVILPDRALD